jgi:hypothetical protein
MFSGGARGRQARRVRASAGRNWRFLLAPQTEAETACVIPETRYAKAADGVNIAYPSSV